MQTDFATCVQNGAEGGYPIGKGCDLFVSVWNLHRSPYLWRDPDAFRPERFFEANSNADFGGKWAGYRCALRNTHIGKCVSHS